MIRSLRTRHRVVFVLLLLILPVIYVGALVVRKTVPSVESFPKDVSVAPDIKAELIHEGSFPENTSVRFRVLRNSEGLFLEIRPGEDLKKPDILIYWCQHQGSVKKIPEDAILLGILAGTETRVYPLPENADWAGSGLILYSLGHQQVLDTVALSAKNSAENGGKQ